MSEVIKLLEGQSFEIDGVKYTVENGKPEVAIAKRGPFGGELKILNNCKMGEQVIISAVVIGGGDRLGYIGLQSHEGFVVEAYGELEVETNTPSPHTLTPIAAGELAKDPNCIGRWITFDINDEWESRQITSVEHGSLICKFEHTKLILDNSNKVILLPEGLAQ